MSSVSSGLIDLFNTLFTLYVSFLLLRLFLPRVGADYNNPISQFVIKITDPTLLPVRRIMPRTAYLDISLVSLIIIFEFIKFSVLYYFQTRYFISISSLVIYSLADILRILIDMAFWFIILRVIISWVAPSNYNPALDILYRLTNPLLAPFQRIIPSIGGLDISPIILFVCLRFISIVIIFPLEKLAGTLI